MNHSFHLSATRLAFSSVVLAGLALAGCTPGGAGSAAGGGGGDTLATVGSTKVTRAELADFLVAQGGEQALPYLIDTQLLMESLKSKGLDVTDAEVDADLKRRQAADPTLATLISSGGSKLDTAKRQIKRDLAVQKLLTADVKPTEAQIKAFAEKYRTYYDTPATIKTGLLFASTKARADLLAKQLAAKTKTFEAIVAEQKKANDPVAGQSTTDSGRFDPLVSFPANIRGQLEKMPKGSNTSPQQLNVGLPTPVFAIFRKVDFQPAKKADFAALRPQLEMDYKLAEVARKTNAENPTNPPFEETLKRTQDFMQSQNPGGTPPKLRDVLSYINQTAAAKLMTTLRSAGTVQVDDPTYATVAKQYEAATPTPGAGTPAAGAAGAPAPAAGAGAGAPATR
ncbi:MAG TPA: peptidylprolyl isomerase [Abditibacterium sp.]